MTSMPSVHPVDGRKDGISSPRSSTGSTIGRSVTTMQRVKGAVLANLTIIRAIGKASLSIIDMVMDVYMIIVFLQEERVLYAKATIACLSTNILFQLVLIFFQNREVGWKRMLSETLLVFTFIKPGVNAYRVLMHKEPKVGNIMNPQIERTCEQTIEMITECIPGAIIQIAAAVSASKHNLSLGSSVALASSLLSGAFTAASIGFDWDITVDNRTAIPEFYGIVPDNLILRVTSLFLLTAVSFANLLLRSLFVVLLALKSRLYPVVLLTVEFLVFLSWKIFRNDFEYWLDLEEKSLFAGSLLIRLIVKVVGDWGAVVQFRHDNEIGGAYFTITLVVTIGAALGAAFTYEGPMVEGGFSKGNIQQIVLVASVSLAASFCTVLALAPKKQRGSFFTWTTCSQGLANTFRMQTIDQHKFNIFRCNQRKWRNIAGEEVTEWLDNKLEYWLDHPDEIEWFTDYNKSLIPSWAVKKPWLMKRLHNKKVKLLIKQKANSKGALSAVFEKRATAVGLNPRGSFGAGGTFKGLKRAIEIEDDNSDESEDD